MHPEIGIAMTEKEKCRAGMLYNPNYDPELQQEMMQAADACFRYNNTPPSHMQERDEILTGLLGRKGANCCIRSPFFCDYGYNIEVGDNFFANYNFVGSTGQMSASGTTSSSHRMWVCTRPVIRWIASDVMRVSNMPGR